MFSQSFDCTHQLHLNYPPSPPQIHEIRKRQDDARRHRMVEAQRRRQVELERMIRMEEKLKIEEHRRRKEGRQWRYEEEEERLCQLHTLSGKDDDEASSCPPLVISISSQEESVNTSNPSRDSAMFPPISTASKPGRQAMLPLPRAKSKSNTIRRADTDLSSICSEENFQDPDEIDDDDPPALPHIIAVDYASDNEDDEEDEDLNTLWEDLVRRSEQWIGLRSSIP